jgi:hypothetical protein
LASLTQAVTRTGGTVGVGVIEGVAVAAGVRLIVGEGCTGAWVAAGMLARVGVETEISGVSDGWGGIVGVGGGVEVAVKDGGAVGVDDGVSSGEALVTLGKRGTSVSSGLTGYVGFGATSSLEVTVDSGLILCVGVMRRLAGIVKVGLGPGSTAHPASAMPSAAIRIA